MYQQQSRPVAPKLNFSSIVTIVVVAIILMVCSTCFYTVDTGERGVVLRFGSLNSVANEGLNFKVPVADNVKFISIRDKNLTIHTEVSSSDIQTISVDVALVYSLDPSEVGRIFQTYGENIENTLIRPTLSEKVNAVIAEYPIETFVEKRAEISNKINSSFSEQVAGTGIKVKSLLITNHDFSDDFN